MVFFNNIELAPPDPIFGLQALFNSDPRPHKVNLSVGVYKDINLRTPVLECVKKAEADLIDLEKSKEYLPIDGDTVFLDRVGQLIFGSHLWVTLESSIYAAQSIGGTGALRIGGDFLKQEVGSSLFVSQPTWPNHIGIFTQCKMKVEKYPYYDFVNKKVNFEAFYQFLEKLPPKSIVLLHACCHNPTGADLALEEWDKLSDLFLEKELFPFFDSAYQGFAKGLEEDAAAIRLFAAKGHEMIVASSFSKNFSLYAERIGALFIVSKSHTAKKNIGSRVKPIIRTGYSNPALHGAHIIGHILGSVPLKSLWEEELSSMRERINKMRVVFAERLIAKSREVDYHFMMNKVGLFSFSGLSSEQVSKLISDYGIYMTQDGRINVAGINEKNLDYIVDAILKI